MPTIKYSNNPNSDTAFVVQDGGQKNRAVLTAEPAGTLQLSDSANVSTGYVTGEDGKKHKVNLVAQLEGEVEFSENPNSTKGYVTVDSKKHRVVLTASLHGGGEPINNQDKIITENGSYTADEGYTGLGTVTVNVPTTAPAHYIEKTVDANGKLQNSAYIINLNGVTDVGDGALAYAYNKAYFPANTSIDLSGLTTMSGSNACYYMFSSCTSLASVDLSGLTTISGSNACQSMFFNCTGLTSVDLSSLTTISGSNACFSMFQACTRITSVNLSSLTTISGSCNSMFSGCTNITSIDLSGLTTINSNSACQSMFQRCTSLSTVYIGGITAIDFGGKTNVFANIFQGCTQNIDVYAPAANQAKIESFSGYPKFGGTGNVVWHWRS